MGGPGSAMSSLKQTDLQHLHSHHHQLLQQQQQQQQQQDSQRTRVEQFGNQILRVRGDSDSDMEALFSVLQKKNSAPAIGSFRNRRLPASFFRPPEPKTPPFPLGHDCFDGGAGDAAAAAAAAAVSQGLIHPGTVSTSTTHSPVSSHCRSRSSPVRLLHSQNTSPRHIRQSSMDGCTDEFSSAHPAAWDMATKCPKYQMKRWSQDMHGCYGPLADHLAQHQALDHQQHGICPNQSLRSADLSKHQDFGPLPPGWEQGMTPEGELYFINHIKKTTSWYDPRLLCHAHSMAPVTLCQALPPLERQVPQFSQQPDYLSQQQQQLLPNSLSMPPSARRPLANDQFLCLQLRKLQQEKERLQLEQEAIACREMMLNELVRHSASSSGGDGQLKCMSAGCALNPGQGLQSSSCVSGLDPFLGQAGHGTVESHVRQNSTDSGLGGMGTTYSLPRSPEDYLSNVEEMEGNYKLPLPHNSCCGNSDVNLEMTPVSEMADILEGDHLITSLGEELDDELFDEMDVQKINNLLWL